MHHLYALEMVPAYLERLESLQTTVLIVSAIGQLRHQEVPRRIRMTPKMVDGQESNLLGNYEIGKKILHHIMR